MPRGFCVGKQYFLAYTYLECYGTEKFLEELRHRGTQLNPKYKSLLAQYRRK